MDSICTFRQHAPSILRMDSEALKTVVLGGQRLSLAEIEGVAAKGWRVELDPAALQRVAEGRAWIEEILKTGKTVYGVNTGFGRLADVRVPDESLRQLQINLVRSHAGGVGEPLSVPEARAMLLLRANVLAKGWSGCRPFRSTGTPASRSRSS